MPRPRNIFRLENASKDSGLSFHCCGKPDDLLDEPLDCVNETRRARNNSRPSRPEGRTTERRVDSLLVATLRNEHRLVRGSRSAEVLSPGVSSTSSSSWSLQSLLFWPSPSGSNSKSNSRIKKFWCKKHVEASNGSDKEADPSGTSEGSGEPKQLRSVRSLPLLNGPVKATLRRNRGRSGCLAPLSFSSGLDRPVDEHEKSTRSTNELQRPNLADLPTPETDRTPHEDSTRAISSKPHPVISSKPSKIFGLLSMGSWSNLFLNRHQKEEKTPEDVL